MATDEIDFESRQLCPDGACVGVIGADGRCKVCGAASDGAPASASWARTDEDDEPSDPDDDDGTAAADRDDELAARGFDGDRELCPDGACIGLIGANGRCKVCGTPRGATGETA